MNQLPPPKSLSFAGNASENFKSFKQCFEIYMIAAGLDKKDDAVKANILLHVLGEEALGVYNGFIWGENEDKLKSTDIFKRLEEYCTPRTNVALERHKFYSRVQNAGESFDSFFTAVCNLSSTCAFGTLKDEMLRDRLVCGIRAESVRLRLLRTDDLTLLKCVQICRAAEATERQSAQIQPNGAVVLNRVKSSPARRGRGKPFRQFQQRTPQSTYQQSSRPPAASRRNTQPGNKCTFCGKHPHERKQCPARDASCHKCKKKGHFKSVCRSSAVNNIQGDSGDVTDFDYEEQQYENVQDNDNYLFSLSDGHTTDWCVKVRVNSTSITFRVDSGADVTIIPKALYDSDFAHIPLRPAIRILRGPDNKSLHCLGYFMATFSRAGLVLQEKEVYVLAQGAALLSRGASQDLKVITFVGNVNACNVAKEFPGLFSGLGKMPEPYKIRLGENAQPYAVSYPRRVPLPLMPKVKVELERLEKLGVIRPVSKPTEWCAPIVVVPKSSEQVRICVDLSKLNMAVKRERLMLPSVDHTLGQLAGAAIFSKLDANCGFHQIALEDESQLLTTFITPFERYAYQRLPFGINSGQSTFKSKF
jgi:hypothetical protein